ncbi:hypothetical protein, partial [Bacillus sp. FJAT-27445]|uniref:hypothetical protein n=1 Tax=Bacillus sp. FJAT-27445 TaxID=1679166 RepID=UPI001C129964
MREKIALMWMNHCRYLHVDSEGFNEVEIQKRQPLYKVAFRIARQRPTLTGARPQLPSALRSL